jgi:hypothetical protein
LKLKQSEINKLARKIAKINTLLWDAIGMTDELVCDETLIEIIRGNDEYDDILKKIALAFDKLDRKDTELIDMEMRSHVTQNFDSLANRINEELNS